MEFASAPIAILDLQVFSFSTDLGWPKPIPIIILSCDQYWKFSFFTNHLDSRG